MESKSSLLIKTSVSIVKQKTLHKLKVKTKTYHQKNRQSLAAVNRRNIQTEDYLHRLITIWKRKKKKIRSLFAQFAEDGLSINQLYLVIMYFAQLALDFLKWKKITLIEKKRLLEDRGFMKERMKKKIGKDSKLLQRGLLLLRIQKREDQDKKVIVNIYGIQNLKMLRGY